MSDDCLHACKFIQEWFGSCMRDDNGYYGPLLSLPIKIIFQAIKYCSSEGHVVAFLKREMKQPEFTESTQ